MASPAVFSIDQSSLSFWVTCDSAIIRWTSTIPEEIEVPIRFSLHSFISSSPSAPVTIPTDEPSPSDPNTRRSLGRRAPSGGPVVRTFEATSTARNYLWDQVDVPQGLYYLVAYLEPGYPVTETTNEFLILNGTDSSCLAAQPSPSTSAGSLPTTPVSQTVSASQSDTLEPTQTNQLPVKESGKVNVGAIAGGVVGGVAGAIILIVFAVFFFLRRRRHPKGTRPPPSIKSTKSGKRGTGKSGSQVGNWKGLGSVDLNDPEMGHVSTNSRGSSHKESTGSNEDSEPPSLAYTASPPLTDLSHEEKKVTVTSHKKPARKPVPSYLDAIPTTTPFSSTTHLESPRLTTASSPSIPHTSITSSPASEYQNYDSRRLSTRPLRHAYVDYPKDEDEAQAELMVANLQRSASQGDMLQMKPVHYLMPDLPLDQQYHARRS